MGGIKEGGFGILLLCEKTESDTIIKRNANPVFLKLDRLNNRNDPQPDGVFDYVEGYTVLSSMGRIVFPLLEPFGKDLKERVFTNLEFITALT